MTCRKAFITTLIAMVGIACGVSASAQSEGGKLNVRCNTVSLDSLLIQSSKSNSNQTQIDGFRIQIYSGSGVSSKTEAENVMSKFTKMYPAERVYVIYTAPFWRVRVGDYRSKSEALPLLNTIQGSFSGSYIVYDNTVKKSTFRK